MANESQPINVDLLMETIDRVEPRCPTREVIHELAVQLYALQREFYELKDGGLTIDELRDDLERSRAEARAEDGNDDEPTGTQD